MQLPEEIQIVCNVYVLRGTQKEHVVRHMIVKHQLQVERRKKYKKKTSQSDKTTLLTTISQVVSGPEYLEKSDLTGGGEKRAVVDNPNYHVVDAEDCEVQMAANAAEVQAEQVHTSGISPAQDGVSTPVSRGCPQTGLNGK